MNNLQNKQNQIIKSDTYTVQTYNYLRNAILNNEFKPGEVYSQDQISTLLNISRTPTREALIQLQKEGYVRFLRGIGFEIVTPSQKDIDDINELRMVIERATAGWAAKNATKEDIKDLGKNLEKEKEAKDDIQKFLELDEEFHMIVWRASDNGQIYDITSNLRSQLLRSGHEILRTGEYKATVIKEHQDVFDAIAAHDVSAAENAMQAHLYNTKVRNRK